MAPNRHIKDLLQKRGPDAQNSICDVLNFRETDPSNGLNEYRLHISIDATVLSLRGTSLVTQPLIDQSSGSVFCWNGEAWRFMGQAIQGNDSEFIFQNLMGRIQDAVHDASADLLEAQQRTSIAVRTVLGQIEGPFTFLYYDAACKLIFYGRDTLGRRSLLINTTNDHFVLSSVAHISSSERWTEVEADGVYEVDLAGLAKRLSLARNPRNVSPNKSSDVGVPITRTYSWESIKLVRCPHDASVCYAFKGAN
jgi:asparagine synthetase B (glutamine-hydrolysing)